MISGQLAQDENHPHFLVYLKYLTNMNCVQYFLPKAKFTRAPAARILLQSYSHQLRVVVTFLITVEEAIYPLRESKTGRELGM